MKKLLLLENMVYFEGIGEKEKIFLENKAYFYGCTCTVFTQVFVDDNPLYVLRVEGERLYQFMVDALSVVKAVIK